MLIHFFLSTSSRCMMEIWPAGPPKLMNPSFIQKRIASRKDGCGGADPTAGPSGFSCRDSSSPDITTAFFFQGFPRRVLETAEGVTNHIRTAEMAQRVPRYPKTMVKLPDVRSSSHPLSQGPMGPATKA